MNQIQWDALIQQAPVLLDGATGSNLRLRGMPAGVCTERWVLENPDVLAKLQKEFVEAGSQIVYAPTFMANRCSLKMFGLEDKVEDYCARLVALSKQAVNGAAFVAGDMSTTGLPIEDQDYEMLLDVYAQQAQALSDAGVDLYVGETLLSVDEATAMVEAIRSVSDLPILSTLTIQADGTLLYGGRIEDALEMLQAVGASAVGINCSVGPDQLESVVRSMKSVCAVPLIVKPNAGIPVMDRFGVAHYSMKDAPFADYMMQLVDAGADLIGGCCGTTPKTIAALKQALAQRK